MHKNKSLLNKLKKYLKALPLAILLLTANSVFAQNSDNINKEDSCDEIVYDVVEKQPEFPGGIKELMKFLAESIVFTKETENLNIEGKVVANFIVHKDGSTSDISILKGLDSLLDAETIRVLTLMPKWKAGMQNGEAVNVRYTLPVSFRFKNEDDSVDKDKESKQVESTNSTIDKDEVFVLVVKQPEFPGGIEAFMNYLSEKVRYPDEALKDAIEGEVIVSFDVNKDGSISDIAIARSLHPLLDNEAMRVLIAMPNWSPATKSGKPVKMKVTWPISFSLNYLDRKY